jgi:hypothetical protein
MSSMKKANCARKGGEEAPSPYPLPLKEERDIGRGLASAFHGLAPEAITKRPNGLKETPPLIRLR